MAKKLGERLVEAGLVSSQAVEQGLQQQRITGHKLGECLVQIGLLDEQVLLRFLAAELKTRFVSTEKLSKVRVDIAILDRVPVRMCEAQHFVPIAFDPARKQLSIVASDPQNEALMNEIALVTNSSEVVAYVALRSAVQAAIKKLYYGDSAAFEAIDTSAARADLQSLQKTVETTSDSRPAIVAPWRMETDPRIRTNRGTSLTSVSTLRDGLGIVRSAVADNDYVETLNVLVGLLEISRRELKGHSSQLARQASQVGKRMGLGPREVSQLAIAAYLHDLGKPADRHFTLASNARAPEWKADAKRYARAPVKLFEAVHLPPQVNAVLAQLYEAYDGSGVPGAVKTDDIALGARILAAVDSVLDLMKNPANAHGRTFSRDEALAFLRDESGKLFDPAVVEAVRQIYSGDLLRQRVQSDGRQVLVADDDDKMRAALSEAITQKGLVVEALAELENAIDAALSGDVDVLVVSLRFGVRPLVQAIESLKAQPRTAALPVILLGEPTDAPSRTLLFHAGVTEILKLPLESEKAAETVVALFKAQIEHGIPGRPVRGSFDELSQLELWRMLGAARKSGRVTYRVDGKDGLLHLEKGRVVAASVSGQNGEAALKLLARLPSAEFTYDPDGLLLDVPQLDVDLERLVGELESQAA